jgi:hypothetical protein
VPQMYHIGAEDKLVIPGLLVQRMSKLGIPLIAGHIERLLQAILMSSSVLSSSWPLWCP